MNAAHAWLQTQLVDLMSEALERALRAPEGSEETQEWAGVAELLAALACHAYDEPCAVALLDQATAESERRFLRC